MKKGNLFKKLTAFVLVGAMAVGTMTGCGNSNKSDKVDNTKSGTTETKKEDDVKDGTAETKKYKIGIAEAQANDEVTTRRAYLEKYIAPLYNVEFVFSETLKDDAATKTFIENCIDSGADAVIDFKSNSEQFARLCEENGLVYTVNGTFEQEPALKTEKLPLFTGVVGANNPQVGKLFGDWLEETASADGSDGFLVSTSLASQGNVQHVEVTRAILEGLQQKYGITYEQSIEDLIASSETTNVANDKNILITLYPGSPNKDTWLPGVSSLLQTGKYKMFLASGQTYNQSAQVVDEVEKAFKIDIKIASVGALGAALTTAFNTLDNSGNPSVDLITIKSVSCLTACLFAITLNALDGAMDQACRIDGMPTSYNFNFIPVTSAEQLTAMSGWDDRDSANWIASDKVVDQMLVRKTPQVKAEDIQKLMESLDYEQIKGFMQK